MYSLDPMLAAKAAEGARLLLSVGDAPNQEPPYSQEVLQAVKACGSLPLTLAVAGP